MTDSYAVDVEGVSKSFGAFKALNGVNLRVRQGEIYGLLGPNGAGKTTLIRLICGLLAAQAGTVTVLGQRMPNVAVLRQIGYMTQQAALYPALSVEENVSFFAAINGADQVPAGWASCDPPGAAQAGVRDQGGQVTSSGNSTVTGTPPIVNDPSINNGTFTTFGGATFAQLAARATITLPGGNYSTAPVFNGDGSCDKTVLTNWGDGDNPTSQCGSYWPIIYLTGTTTLNNTQGQGILLVDGDLNIQGSYQFYGIVIIQGDLKTAGGGTTDAHFWGGVMAKNADLSVQNITGKATLNFSSCSILQALQATSPISMMRSRGWTQLY